MGISLVYRQEKTIPEILEIKSNFDCNYTFLIDFRQKCDFRLVLNQSEKCNSDRNVVEYSAFQKEVYLRTRSAGTNAL